MRIQLQGLHRDIAAGFGHGAGISGTITEALGAGDVLAVLAPGADQFVVEQDEGALFTVQPVARHEGATSERLGLLAETECIDMTFNDDESVTLRWDPQVEEERVAEVESMFEVAMEQAAPF